MQGTGMGIWSGMQRTEDRSPIWCLWRMALVMQQSWRQVGLEFDQRSGVDMVLQL